MERARPWIQSLAPATGFSLSEIRSRSLLVLYRIFHIAKVILKLQFSCLWEAKCWNFVHLLTRHGFGRIFNASGKHLSCPLHPSPTSSPITLLFCSQGGTSDLQEKSPRNEDLAVGALRSEVMAPSKLSRCPQRNQILLLL